MECAFRRLKGRWRCLLKRNNSHLSFVPAIVTTCCVLHNLCEVHGDGFDDDWTCAEEVSSHSTHSSSTTIGTNTTAENIRQALCQHFI